MGGLLSRFSSVGISNATLDTSNHTDTTDEVIDLKGDQFQDRTSTNASLNLNYKNLWALALTTSVGGHFFAWNEGLSAGFGSYIIATVLISSGYISLLFSIAELSSALPFAGK